MTKFPEYRCSTCGKVHSGAPSFSFKTPFSFNDSLSKNKKLSDDFCHIDGDFFIRTILEIPIVGLKTPFLWGVWVSQSEKNFKFYLKHFNDNLLGRTTFGWLSNKLPYYKDTLNLQTNVIFQGDNSRPKLHVLETKHELSEDFHKGISIEKALKISKLASHPKN